MIPASARCWRCDEAPAAETSPTGLCEHCAEWLRVEVDDALDEPRRIVEAFLGHPVLSEREVLEITDALARIVAVFEPVARALVEAFSKIAAALKPIIDAIDAALEPAARPELGRPERWTGPPPRDLRATEAGRRRPLRHGWRP